MSDLISRQSLLNNLERYRELFSWDDGDRERAILSRVIKELQSMPSAELIRCEDCKWWDKDDGSPYGYCLAMKHGYITANWEIGIYRRYKGDFYCADAEMKEEDEEEEDE